MVLLVEYGAFQALFAGDAGFPAEAAMAAQVGRVDVLKVGHHGSRGSTRRCLARRASAAAGGDLGRPERLRAPGAGDAGPAGGARGRGAPHRSEGTVTVVDRRHAR